MGYVARSADIAASVLFDMFATYYQCDTAAYTVDGGGYKFLEHLFEYRKGEKVFDPEEGLFRFSGVYEEKFLQLKVLISNAN